MENTQNFKTVILISSDTEWKVVKNLFPHTQISRSPFGEQFEYWLGSCLVLFFHSGWGKVTASATCQYVIDRYHPEVLFNLGTCGGFRGQAEVGEVILVDRSIIYDIVEQMSDPQEAIDFYTTDIDLSWLTTDDLWDVKKDLILSADKDIIIEEIPQLIKRFNARIADWESGAIAWVAARNGQKLLILRGVSDLVGALGGEVYDNMPHYLVRTEMVMRRLIDITTNFLTNKKVDQ